MVSGRENNWNRDTWFSWNCEKGTQKWLKVSLDLPKAYDVLNHKLVLSKSDACRIRGEVNLWFKSYLSYRKQCADISYDWSNTKISGKYISVLKDTKTWCASKSNPWPNFTVIIDKLSFNKYTMGKHSSACLRHRYSNKGCKWQYSRKKKKKSNQN